VRGAVDGVAGNQLNFAALFVGSDAVSVVLLFEHPALAVERLASQGREHRLYAERDGIGHENLEERDDSTIR
jgi:hypothetical protein